MVTVVTLCKRAKFQASRLYNRRPRASSSGNLLQPAAADLAGLSAKGNAVSEILAAAYSSKRFRIVLFVNLPKRLIHSIRKILLPGSTLDFNDDAAAIRAAA